MLLILVLGCGEFEGDDPGECSTGFDEDDDGLTDCEDPDCAGSADCEEDTPPVDTGPFDSDGDGFSAAEDCDDSNAEVHPNALEVCDGIDNDCDEAIDDLEQAYLDEDGDGYGSELVEADCDTEGVSAIGGDCDDTDASRHPEAEEECDEIDQDCDDLVDEGLEYTTTWPDEDGDGYGAEGEEIETCAPPEDHVEQGGDCDDTDANVNPDAAEVCDEVDNDCDPSTQGSGVNFTDSSGTASTPTFDGSEMRLGTGTLAICDAGTYAARIFATGDLIIAGGTGDPADVVLDGEGDRIVVYVSGYDLTISGLTITGGSNEGGDGGGVQCSSNGSVTMSEVVLTGNEARRGAAFAGTGCDFSLEDSLSTDNTGEYAPGGYLHDGRLDMTNSEVSDNTAAEGIGGLYMGNARGTWDEVLLADNTAYGAIGALSCNQCELAWTGTTSTTSGMLRNTSNNPGSAAMYMPTNSSLEADVLDLGDGIDDNDPHDIYSLNGGYYDDGDDVSFSCYEGCE